MLSLSDQRKRLPAFKSKRFQVVIVVGQTGSGKTTQLPQYLAEVGWCDGGKMVGCTQPRRVAVTSIAARVAEEMGVTVGESVGYTVRFDNQSDDRLTKIKYLTDGMLFREILQDPLLSKYSAIMIDEAHERSLYTDILIGVLKKIFKKRPELRIIISSATLDAESFHEFYNTNATSDKEKDTSVIMSLDGRMYPVHVYYLNSPCKDYLQECINTVFMINQTEKSGDILIFLTGRDEVEKVVAELAEQSSGSHTVSLGSSQTPILALPLYGGLTPDEQRLVFSTAPTGTRKVVVSTNIAEASITIDGIVYVIDAGFVKIRSYNSVSETDTLMIVPTSQASAQQRAGRAGRTRPGKVFRLYCEDAFSTLPPTSTPEIQRSNLSPLILQLKAIGIDNVLNFDFLSPPPAQMLSRALELLYSLKALDDYGRLSMPLGSMLAEIPLDPMLAVTILNGHQFECTEEILTVAAILSVEPIFLVPNGRFREAEDARRKFAVEEGDHITYINVYEAFLRAKKSSKWCYSNFLNANALNRAVSVRQQLRQYLRRYGISDFISCGANTVAIRKCIISGYFSHAAKLKPDGSYSTLRDSKVLYIHPNSTLFKRSPEWVVFHEVVETTKPYMRDVMVVQPEWLPELAIKLINRKTNSSSMWSAMRSSDLNKIRYDNSLEASAATSIT
ncbi:hypothetical protein BDEG_22243 [Batrachochytrium dendrobatidis JEL423]|uniref:RNA helicase n=1 Tax=Batrachochytrium dendrobatidis (strain JEL423) TaxID=403673 RepID=A0A177WES9_BATDL|nr:hypothetical protein BDEG_22243 [Batrachochytrium dendrobatidis JEL423]